MRTKPKTVAAVLVLSICASLAVQAAPVATPAAVPVAVPAAAPVAVSVAAPAATPAAVPVAAPVAVPVVVPVAVPAVVPVAATKSALPSAAATSVLERFRTYSGPRTPAALSELFSAPFSTGVRQLPEIVLSNGAVPVSIAVVIPAQGSTAPNFAFNGARLLSNELIRKDEWLIVALPETGVIKATMIVLSNGAVLEIPLTVAPPLSAGTDLSEKGFIAFLGDKASAAKPLLDINGDGRRDYLDDYIFTANYLANKHSGGTSPVDAEVPRAAQTPSQSELDYNQLLRDQAAEPARAAEAARAAEQKAAAEGQSAIPAFGSGWGSGAGATSNTGGAPATTTGVYTVTPAVTPAGTPDVPPGSTPAGNGEPLGWHTITSPTGKTLTYYGTSTPSRLNMRNLGAKETADALKNK